MLQNTKKNAVVSPCCAWGRIPTFRFTLLPSSSEWRWRKYYLH